MITLTEHIHPLFREKDVQSMAKAFDFQDCGQVRANAVSIYRVLSASMMQCEGPWPAARVAVLKQWMDAGYPA